MSTEASTSHDAYFRSWRRHIDLRLRQVMPIPKESTQLVHSAMDYAVEGGHRWRPLLLISAYQESSGHDISNAIDIACAIELIHCCTIILDDLPSVDNADLRRGKPSCHKVYGDAVTVYASHLLYALAEHLASETAKYLELPQGLIRHHFYKLKERLIKAQELELNLSRGLIVASDVRLQELYELKASLFTSATWLGATFATCDKEIINHLQEYGKYIGMGYQLADDITDITGKVEDIGKPVGMDTSKINFVNIHGVEQAKELFNEYWLKATVCLDQLPFNSPLLRHIGTRILGIT